MSKKLFVALLALIALASACSATTVETTGEGEVVVNAAPADDATVDGASADGGSDSSDDGNDASNADGSDSSAADDSSTDEPEAAPSGTAMIFADAMSGGGVATSARFEGTFRITGISPDAPKPSSRCR